MGKKESDFHDKLFDLQYENELNEAKTIISDKMDNIDKKIERINKKTGYSSAYTLPASEREKLDTERDKLKIKRNTLLKDYEMVYNEIKLLKDSRKLVVDTYQILSKEDGIRKYNTQSEADNSFVNRPTEIKDRLVKELDYEYEYWDKVRDYPLDECDRKLDLKEWVYHFKHKKLPIDCDVNIISIGSDENCLKDNPKSSKINSVLTCKKREPEQSNPKTFETFLGNILRNKKYTENE